MFSEINEKLSIKIQNIIWSSSELHFTKCEGFRERLTKKLSMIQLTT